MTVHITLNTFPIILIDCSYYIFYRYYATLKWFGFQNKNIDTDDIHNNIEFIEAFKKHFKNDIAKICKKWKTKPEYIYMCQDCNRSCIWRNDILDTYKSQRIHNINFNSEIFNIFNKSVEIAKIASDNLEADDVLSIVYNSIRQIDKDIKITIITNDNDYLQLDLPNTHIYNMQMKDITTRKLFDEIDKELFFKALFGDKSDNIPKIANINKTEGTKITNLSKEERSLWIENKPFKDAFYKNLTLIDFKYIPEDLKKACVDKIKIIKI